MDGATMNDAPTKEKQAPASQDGYDGEDHGQEQERLLGEWEGSTHTEGEDEERPRKRRRWFHTRIAIGVMITTTVAALAIFFVWTYVVDRAIKDHGIEHITRNDYILSPAWNKAESPQVRFYKWTIEDTIYHPDGIYRPMILVNKQFPGPLIEANEGDVIEVKVINLSQNATSIHWHGIFQNGSPDMDGTVGVTQCPIAPLHKQTYKFNVTGQSGTYWWHAHQGVQSSDGVHGPLIIHPRDADLQKLPYKSDRVLLLSDHYWNSSSELLWDYLAPGKENDEPIPMGALINGRSKYRDCDEVQQNYPGRECWTRKKGLFKGSGDLAHFISHFRPYEKMELDTMPDYPSVELTPGQSHRLRLINVGAFADFQFQIDEHELAVTEVDGTDVVPHLVKRVSINPAQRYSVIVNASSVSSTLFWLRARMDTHCFVSSKGVQTDALAVVRYRTPDESKKEREPHTTFNYTDIAQHITSKDWDTPLPMDCRDMNTTSLVPVVVDAPPQHEDAFFYVHSSIKIGNWQLARAMFNDSSFRPNIGSPTLLRASEGLNNNQVNKNNVPLSSPWRRPYLDDNAVFINDDPMAFNISRELVIQTKRSATIDILISNFDDGTHPLHLHGYKFWILAQGHGYPPRQDELSGITRENVQPLYDQLDLRNPMRRDTASVEGYGWILIRVRADNPGAWALHCHVSWHAEAGLVMQLLTNTEALRGMDIGGRKLCRFKGIELGMGPDDEYYYPHEGED